MRTDKSYLPTHYNIKDRPFFKGYGQHNVRDLEILCDEFTTYTHQQSIIKQELRKESAELLEVLQDAIHLLKLEGWTDNDNRVQIMNRVIAKVLGTSTNETDPITQAKIESDYQNHLNKEDKNAG